MLSGRAEERARLLAGVRTGLAGDSRVVLVHGEAGIGKTTLVRDVCAEVDAEGVRVLWGQGLRFGTVDAMYHPLVLALEGWLRTAREDERAGLLAAVPSATLVLPSMGAQPAVTPSGLMLMVDALVEHIASLGPTLLVLDDVQWADPATWDAISYLVAGLGSQPMALVTTHRDEAVVSEAFQRWLGHLRRLPRTEELELERLDEVATAEQVAALLKTAPGPRLATLVFERSRGNPYLSELLVRRLDEGATDLPEELPEELSQALLDAWRGLSDPAREVARVLAVGGRPTGVRTLGVIASELGLSVGAAVREAVEGGVLVLDRVAVWFRHPLLAAVLLGSYLPGEDETVHAAWARHLETTSSQGVDELRRLGDLAAHHERAGARAPAFAALVAAAELAEQLGAPRERADLLLRAVELWDASPDPLDSLAHAELLTLAATALAWVDRKAEGSEMMRQARDLGQGGDPVLAGHLVERSVTYSWPDVESHEQALAELDHAIELMGTAPDSREYAEPWVTRAFILFWARRPAEAREALDAAFRAAERSGSDSAMSGALQVQCHLTVADGDLALADELAEASWRHAVASGDDVVMWESGSARYMVAHSSGDLHRRLDVVREQSEWAYSRGLVLPPSCDLSYVYLVLGDLRAAEGAVRRGLTGTGDPKDEAEIRVSAGLLASRQGKVHAAREHLARAYEVLPDLEQRPFAVRATTVADLLLALGEPHKTIALVERLLPKVALDPRFPDELLVRGATAAADLVQQATDNRDRDAVRRHREALDRLVALRDEVSTAAPFQPSNPRDRLQAAHAALFAAEAARAGGVPTSSLWLEAASACAAAGMEWEQRSAQLRAAELRIESGAPGREVADMLRDVRAYAVAQDAAPLSERAEELAAAARVSLAEPVMAHAGAIPTPFAGLTARESEVLSHLVANRTYAEIAQALFISEKTVSVHVSNLLRKTGTGSRREVSALARRVGFAVSPSD